MEITVGTGSSTSSSTIMGRKKGGGCYGHGPKRLCWSNQTHQSPRGPVSSALSPRPMLLSVLAWLFYPGSCLGHQATFLHMHRLNFWPGTSSQGCTREMVVRSGVVGLLRSASSVEPCLLWPGALCSSSGVHPRDLRWRHQHYHITDVQYSGSGWLTPRAQQPLFLHSSLSVSLLQTDMRSGALSPICCSTQLQWLCCTVRQTCMCVCTGVVCTVLNHVERKRSRGPSLPASPPSPL